MEIITKEHFDRKKAEGTNRRCFRDFSGVQEKKQEGVRKSFSVPFKESIDPVFGCMTGKKLLSGIYGNYYV